MERASPPELVFLNGIADVEEGSTADHLLFISHVKCDGGEGPAVIPLHQFQLQMTAVVAHHTAVAGIPHPPAHEYRRQVARSERSHLFQDAEKAPGDLRIRGFPAYFFEKKIIITKLYSRTNQPSMRIFRDLKYRPMFKLYCYEKISFF